MVQEKNSFQRQRDRDVANLLPAPPVVASESQEGWRSATPVHRGHNSSDDSLQLMALSRALNPSSLIGESSGKWGLVGSRRAGGLHTLPILRQPAACGAAVPYKIYCPAFYIRAQQSTPPLCSLLSLSEEDTLCSSYCMKEILSHKTLNVGQCPFILNICFMNLK